MAQLLNPFTRPGRFYRGVFHCHTTNSDGARSVESATTWYAEQGYDVVAITDHNQVTPVRPPRGGQMLVIPGTEVDVGRTQLGEAYHLVGIGLGEMIDLPRDVASRQALAAQDVIGALRRAGAVVFVAHPYWSGLVADDLLPLEGIAGIEVFNANTEVDIGKGYSGVHWDDCLCRGKLLFGAANDDTHWRMSDHGRAWTMVRAETLTREAVLEALAAGASEVRFICDRRWGYRVVAEGAPLTQATFSLRGRERYVRVEVTTPAGHRAWTNPLFLER